MVQAAMATVLLWAGLAKARNAPAFTAVLRELGVPRRGQRVFAASVIAIELGIALGLIFRPQSIATLAALVGLAAAFALSGLLALRQHAEIHCGCFGPYGGGQLGGRQILAFPLWLAGAGLLWQNAAAPMDLTGAPLFALVTLSMATLRGASTVRAAYAARADRRSAREMFVWLTR
jgi:hypothetical protein